MTKRDPVTPGLAAYYSHGDPHSQCRNVLPELRAAIEGLPTLETEVTYGPVPWAKWMEVTTVELDLVLALIDQRMPK